MNRDELVAAVTTAWHATSVDDRLALADTHPALYAAVSDLAAASLYPLRID